MHRLPADALGATIRRAGTLLAGSGGGQLIALGLSPLLTRLYDPHAFGEFGIFTALTILVASVATLGLENALVIERDAALARVAYGVCILLAATVSVATAGLTWALSQAGCLSAMSAATIWLAGPSVFALSAGQIVINRALRLDRSGAVAMGRLSRGAGVGVAQIALALSAANGTSLVEGGVIGQCLALLATALMLRGTPRPLWGTRGERAQLLERHGALLRWSAPQTLLNNAGNSVVPWILGALAGEAAVGAFALANRVVLLPAVTIGEAMRQSLLAAMSAMADDDEALRGLVLRSGFVLAVPLGVLAALGLVAGPALFGLVFGARWRAAGLDAGLLLTAQAAGMVNIPAVTAVVVRGWQRELFAFGAWTLPVRLAAFATGLMHGVVAGLTAWCALSAAASVAVTLATLTKLRGRRRWSSLEEVAG